jgi:hypothetical protein
MVEFELLDGVDLQVKSLRTTLYNCGIGARRRELLRRSVELHVLEFRRL